MTYLESLRLKRWPLISPEELRKAEQQKKIDRLYGK